MFAGDNIALYRADWFKNSWRLQLNQTNRHVEDFDIWAIQFIDK